MASPPIDLQLHIFRSPELQSVVEEAVTFFNNTPVYTLPPPGRFAGVGVYALYYLGDFELYDYLALRNREQCAQPIYVGKAVPRGWRTARATPEERAQNLAGRLREHIRSINPAENLDSSDFRCRFMILLGVEADLISTVEAQLIRFYLPLWNTAVDGFGNHDPGKGRYNQAPSEWDILHPGRPWVARLSGITRELANIRAKVELVKSRLPLP